MFNLYIVATPIGNLEDISRRALRVLGEVKLIAAEDTRKTRRLLNAYNIKTPTTSYYEHNKLTKLEYIFSRLEEGDVALVSEAGVPGISDPGYELVLEAIRRGVPLVPLPGPSAVTAALTVSGLPLDRFSYLGFLPRRQGERRRFLENLVNESATMVILEAPHRLRASLEDIRDILGDRRLAVCRELTKLHEEIFRGTVSQAIEHFVAPRGEFTLVLEGNPEPSNPRLAEDIENHLRRLRHSGKTAKDAVAVMAQQTGVSKKKLYRLWLKPD